MFLNDWYNIKQLAFLLLGYFLSKANSSFRLDRRVRMNVGLTMAFDEVVVGCPLAGGSSGNKLSKRFDLDLCLLAAPGFAMKPN